VCVSRSELSRACLHVRNVTRELGAKITPPLFRTAHLIKRKSQSEESKRRPILSRWIDDDDDRAPEPSDRPRLTTTCTTTLIHTTSGWGWTGLTRTTIPT
jgi:hypothetical protein